jgi:hypothetical protein
MADAAVSAAATMRALREEAVKPRVAFGPLRDDMDALRAASPARTPSSRR